MPKIKPYQIKAEEPIFESMMMESFSDFDFSLFETSFTESAYTAYASASDVANYCRNLLGSVETFASSTSPNLTAINTWLSSGCSIIEAKLASYGYSIPVNDDTQLYGWLRDLNALYAAARAEMSRINVTLSPGERTRGQVFEEMFWEQLNNLCTLDLVGVGATVNSSGNSILGQTMFVSGTSVAGKDSYKADSDRVKPRFSIGMFSMPGTVSHNSAEDDTE